MKIRLSARSMPATYVVFDLLYEGYRPLLDRPLVERRRRLRQLIEDLSRPQVAFSEGIVGPGRVLFEEVCRQGLEGLVAKRLTSRYRPGKRTTAWLKIKPRPRTEICTGLTKHSMCKMALKAGQQVFSH